MPTHFVRGRKGKGSDDVKIMLGGVLLKMMLDYKGGEGVKNLRKSDYVTCERSLISTAIHKNMESNILANTFQ